MGIRGKVSPHPFDLVVLGHPQQPGLGDGGRVIWSDGYFTWIYFLKIRKTTLRANPETNVNKFMCVHISIIYIYYI